MGVVHSVVQTILVETSISLGDTTFWPCGSLAAEINNNMEIEVPLGGIPGVQQGVGVHLHSFNMSLMASSCDGKDCKVVTLGHFSTPESKLQLGKNKVTWDVGLTYADVGVLLNDFITPLFMEKKTVDLKLSGDDVSLTTSFANIPAVSVKRLKLEKTLSCKMLAIGDEKEIPEKFCHPENAAVGHRLDTSKGYSITCTPKLSSKVGKQSSPNVVV